MRLILVGIHKTAFIHIKIALEYSSHLDYQFKYYVYKVLSYKASLPGFDANVMQNGAELCNCTLQFIPQDCYQ